jgi:catechol 2,3-dioxygenase-like lactoylglutathione lyase family enzyme
MTVSSSLHHVAYVVESLAPTLAFVSDEGWSRDEIESFPNEGTRECYVGDADGGRVLLMEPTSSGPYASALERRGPGLHHVALHVNSLDAFLQQHAIESGWLLHPASFETRKQSKTIWLARPGVGALVEIHETNHANCESYFVDRVHIPGLASRDGLRQIFAACGVVVEPGDPALAVVAGTEFQLDER